MTRSALLLPPFHSLSLFTQVDAMDLDLSSLKSVAAFAAAFKQRKLPLHLLINNAGAIEH